jgi:hypothetical protein
MKPEDRYHRFVRWSDEDQCYIGNCPDINYGGCCHGEQEEAMPTSARSRRSIRSGTAVIWKISP